MRTNIVLDDKLVSKAFKLCSAKSKRELIDQALREFVRNHQRKDVRKLRGKIHIAEEYDHKTLRKNSINK